MTSARSGLADGSVARTRPRVVPFETVKIHVLFVIALLASLCAACGGGNGPNPSPTNYGSSEVSLI